jgi:hypothetical protein
MGHQKSGKNISLSMSPSISLTASVGSVGELKLRGQSDDEEYVAVNDASVATQVQCRVAVAINQLVDVCSVNDTSLLVLYSPSTNKLQDTTTFKSLRSSLGVSFRRRRQDQEVSSIMDQYPRDSYHFYVRFSGSEQAEAMKISLLRQIQRFYECMVWLSNHFRMPRHESSVVMLTCGQEGKRQYTQSFPELGEELKLPKDVSSAMCALARGELDEIMDIKIQVYLETPVGLATATVGLMELEQSFVDGAAPMEAIGKLRNEDEEGEYCWQVNLAYRAVRGDTVIGKVEKRVETVAKSEKRKNADTQVRRKQSRGLGAPLVVSLVALKAAKGVVKNLRGAHRKERKNASPVDGTHLYQWSIVLLGVDVSLQPKRPKAGAVGRTVSTTHCTSDDFNRLDHAHRLPPSFETLIERNASILSHDLAWRFLVGLDSEAKAYAGIIKMIDFWRKHDLSSLKPDTLAFGSMKSHYPHGVIGWSKKSDCLITFEAMGKWPDAYKNVLQDGVSEDAILHHMLVCYLFNFQELDDRAWPHGKTVKIMDLEGLKLGHINTAGFKFITSIANVLAIMFPQRMHQCIFVNAPSFWNVAWSVMKNVVPEKVRSQMQVFNKGNKDRARDALLEWIDSDSLPVRYGGTSGDDMFDNEYEQRLTNYVNDCS